MLYNLISFDVSCSSLRPGKISGHFWLILTVFGKFWLKRTFFAPEILFIRLLIKFCVELVSFIDNTLCVGGITNKKPLILAVFGKFRHQKIFLLHYRLFFPISCEMLGPTYIIDWRFLVRRRNSWAKNSENQYFDKYFHVCATAPLVILNKKTKKLFLDIEP